MEQLQQPSREKDSINEALHVDDENMLNDNKLQVERNEDRRNGRRLLLEASSAVGAAAQPEREILEPFADACLGVYSARNPAPIS